MGGGTATVRDALRQARSALASTSDTPGLDAGVLLAHVTGWNEATIIVRGGDRLDAGVLAAFLEMVERRAAGEPVAHLTGEREFWSLELAAGAAALIPRPETETLVERALARIPPDATWHVLDLGTGSGNIAIALALERPRCRLCAVEVDDHALALAHRNTRRHRVNNVELLHGSWYEPLGDRRFNMIVGNPPYIASGDVHLDRGDVVFEPRRALVSGPEGLDDIRHIVGGAIAHLANPGWLLLEHGSTQGAAVGGLFRRAGLLEVETIPDIGGRERVTEGRAPS